MKTLKAFIPSVIAIVAAILVSLFLIETWTVKLLCVVVGAVGLSVSIARWSYMKQARLRSLVSTLAAVGLFVAIAWSHAPLRIAFRIYRADFDRVASQIEAGAPPATPFWIGPFRIRMVGRGHNSGPPYLATNEEAGEVDGFVTHPDGRGFNLWSCITLDDAWSYIAED